VPIDDSSNPYAAGYLRQEPVLDDGETVMENVMAGLYKLN
jgi:hypothetical protein